MLVDGEIVARRHNERELTNDPTAHAEVLALRDAAAAPADRGASTTPRSWSRSSRARCAPARRSTPACERVVFGARDLNAGAMGSLYQLGADPRLNHEFAVTPDVRADECAALLTDFFADRR